MSNDSAVELEPRGNAAASTATSGAPGSTPAIVSVLLLDRLPFPPTSGMMLRYCQAIEALGRLGPVHLVVITNVPGSAGQLPPGLTLLRLERRMRKGVRHRLAGLLGSQVKRRLRAVLYDRHVERLRKRVAAVLARTRPALVVVEGPDLAGYLPAPRSAPFKLVYDAHNVEKVLRATLLDPARGDRGPGLSPRLHEEVIAGEAALVARSDQIWACSALDAAGFEAAYPDPPAVRLVPNCVDTVRYDSAAASPRRGDGRTGRTALYVGNFEWPPNREAAAWILRDIGPELARRWPDFRLVLCGRRPEALEGLLADRPAWLELTGDVPDTLPHFEAADVLLVPLLMGGGTRLKILEAFAAGLPVISTAKGAEGLVVEPDRHLVIADDTQAFVRATLMLWREPARASALAVAARELVEREYSYAANGRRVRAAVETLLATR